MAKSRFEYPDSVPVSDCLPTELSGAGVDFLEKLFDPGELPTAAGPFTEWKYAPDGIDAGVFVFEGKTGVEGLMAYRAQFRDPVLIGYDIVGVPLSQSFDVPHGRAQRVGGFFFRSYFNLPTDDAERPLPQGMPPVSLIMDEHLVFGVNGKVVGRMYRPYDENGVMGAYSDRPDVNQHNLVARQVEYFGDTGEPLPLPTARQAFTAAYPGVEFTSPEPPPFLGGLPQRQ